MNRETNFSESEGIMRKFSLILIAAVCLPAFAARAQDTNALKTEIGIFESQTGVVIVKGFGQVGFVSTGAAIISVRARNPSAPPPATRIMASPSSLKGIVAGNGPRGL